MHLNIYKSIIIDIFIRFWRQSNATSTHFNHLCNINVQLVKSLRIKLFKKLLTNIILKYKIEETES